MSNKIRWANTIPPNQRSIDSENNIFGKQIKSCHLIDGEEEIDLLDNSSFNEIIRATILTALMGLFSGARYRQHTGFLLTAAYNAPEELKPGGELYDKRIRLVWENSSNIPIQMTVKSLMDIVFVLTTQIKDSAKLFANEEPKLAERRSIRKKKNVDISELIETKKIQK